MSEVEDGEQPLGLFEEGADWFARMRGPDAQELRGEFDAWLSRGALHRAAYNRAAEIFAMGKLIADDGDEPGSRVATPHATRRGTRQALGTASVLLLLAGAWFAFRPGAIPPFVPNDGSAGVTETAEIAAAAGPPRDIRLTDGSIVRLMNGARLGIRFDAALRRLTLHAGFARFKVAHEQRPFIVDAGGGTVTAHGTVFDVGLSADRRVLVHLIEGIIDVKLPQSARRPASVGQSRRLKAGEAISFAAVEPAAAPDGAVPVKAAAPAAQGNEGPQDYDNVRLADLIARANQAASPPIRLGDPLIADERISGRFRIDDSALLAERIAALFSLSLDRSDPKVLVLRRH